jgi:short-subunit dehydrogenase
MNIKCRETVLITGSASGIGYQLARIFAHENYNLVLVDRLGEKLQIIAVELAEEFGIFVKTITKDLSISTSPKEIFTELQQVGIKVDILVNNAGFGNHGLFYETNLNTELEMLQVNLVCLTHLTKLLNNPAAIPAAAPVNPPTIAAAIVLLSPLSPFCPCGPVSPF